MAVQIQLRGGTLAEWTLGNPIIAHREMVLETDTDKFKIGYSYDLTVSQLGNGTSGGSHEVSMGINLKCKKKPKNFRKTSCPSF